MYSWKLKIDGRHIEIKMRFEDKVEETTQKVEQKYQEMKSKDEKISN